MKRTREGPSGNSASTRSTAGRRFANWKKLAGCVALALAAIVGSALLTMTAEAGEDADGNTSGRSEIALLGEVSQPQASGVLVTGRRYYYRRPAYPYYYGYRPRSYYYGYPTPRYYAPRGGYYYYGPRGPYRYGYPGYYRAPYGRSFYYGSPGFQFGFSF